MDSNVLDPSSSIAHPPAERLVERHLENRCRSRLRAVLVGAERLKNDLTIERKDAPADTFRVGGAYVTASNQATPRG